MYLIRLNDEQKRLFLGLAYHIAVVDNNFSHEEQVLIDSYCHEMEIEFEPDIVLQPLDSILSKMQAVCNEQEKKIIVFEAIGLCMVDSTFDTSERELLCTVIKQVGIEKDFLESSEEMIQNYLSFQKKIDALVLG